ncbi:hypothetical protein MGN70_012723 [Eutypa lata]|nr:hypothetical protein MGN70_012723 [Eutypa lata]
MVWGSATLLKVADDRFVDLLDALAAAREKRQDITNVESTQILTGGHRLISNVSRNDSDRALSLKAGTEAVLSFLQSLPTSDAVQLVANIAHVIENSMGRIPELSAIWAKYLEGASQALGRYTPAKPGDRTVVDILQAFMEVFKSTEDLEKAVAAAERGFKSTKSV